MTAPTRRDGKPARKPRLGIPPGVPRPSANAEGIAPSWHELVQPGPKGDPEKALARAERVRHGRVVKQDGDGVPRRHRRTVRRANGMQGEFHARLVRTSPRAQQLPMAALRMALVRLRPKDKRRAERRIARAQKAST